MREFVLSAKNLQTISEIYDLLRFRSWTWTDGKKTAGLCARLSASITPGLVRIRIKKPYQTPVVKMHSSQIFASLFDHFINWIAHADRQNKDCVVLEIFSEK